MTIKTLAKLALIAGTLATATTGAFAYSIHYKDGRYSVTCDNGDRWTRGDGTQQITHADAANICAKRGSSIIAPDRNDPTPRAAKKAPAGFSKMN
ncbi:hypothetical protein ACFPLB_16215 [Aquamicrobium segne]|uniref:Uncharacterized protein n=1 Tax=Aquamicrobium segne TaxID=469547 RepID=A0ABW0H180_9HYPH